MNLAETIYRKSLKLSPEKAQEVIDFIDFLITHQSDVGGKQTAQPTATASPILEAFERAGLVGCLNTDEQLSETYKAKIDFEDFAMSPHVQPLAELNRRAADALIREVGIVDTIRFLNQFRSGHGDYTAEREQLFQGMAVKDIISEIKARRKAIYGKK